MHAGKESARKLAGSSCPRRRWSGLLGLTLAFVLVLTTGCASWRERSYYDGSGWPMGWGSKSYYSSLPSHAPVDPGYSPEAAVPANDPPLPDYLSKRPERNGFRGIKAPSLFASRSNNRGQIPKQPPGSSYASTGGMSAPAPALARNNPGANPVNPGNNVGPADPDVATTSVNNPEAPANVRDPQLPPPDADPDAAPASTTTPTNRPELVPDPNGTPPPPMDPDAPGDMLGGEIPPPTPSQIIDPSAPTPPSKVETLTSEAKEKLRNVRNYQLTMVRQERIGATLQPEEKLTLSIRRTPRAIRMEWAGGKSDGREVIYDPAQNGGKLQVRIGRNSLLPPVSIAPDNPIIKNSSRHPISEAGYEGVIAEVDSSLRRQALGDKSAGRVKYEGPVNLDDGDSRYFGQLVRQTLPSGEICDVIFDDLTALPVMVERRDGQGQLLERYQFREPRFNLAELDGEEAFRSDTRWGKRRTRSGNDAPRDAGLDPNPMPPSLGGGSADSARR